MSRLDPWRNGLEPPKGEDADRILQSNFDEQAKFNDKIGLYLLGEAKTTTPQVVSSTSWIDVAGLKVSATASGGFAQLFANVNAVGNNNLLSLRLMAGDTEIVSGGWNYNAINAGGTISLNGAAAIKSGQTVFKVQARVNAGTNTLQNSNASSNFYILEFTKG